MTSAQEREQQSAHERGAFRISLLLAVILHAGLALTLRAHPPAARPLLVTEVDLVPEPPPPAAPVPPPPAPPPPAPAALAPKPAPIPRASARPPAPTPPPAPAPAILTASDDAQPSAEPVRFVSDPNARGVHYGLVARGGTSPQSQAPPPAPAAAPRERVVPNDQLSRQPTLSGVDCRNHFPQSSLHDLGLVSVIALIEPSGAIARLETESETPPGQGFARAARACLQRQRFSPALDKQGRPALARTRVSIRFAR